MKISFFLAALFLNVAFASPTDYSLAPTGLHKTSIRFLLPFTFGTHKGTASKVRGSVAIDPDELGRSRGEVTVPLDDLVTGNRTRDCHLHEAMGLDYTKSRYPKEHVCNGRGEIPTSGDDAETYPDIVFKLKKLTTATGNKLNLAQKATVEADGEWTMHGQSHPAKIKFEYLPQKDKSLRFRASTLLSLKDYGIIVKSAKVLFKEVTVEDAVTVDLDLLFVPSP